MSDEQPSKRPRLAAAAEALIEAASLETDALTQKRLASNLDSLKKSFDDNLNRVVQTMKSSNENFDAKINTINQHMAGVKSEIGGLKTLLEQERKDKRIERAMTLTHLGSFEYCERNGYGTKQSSDMAKKALEWFLLGYGYILPDGMVQQYPSDKEASKKAFCDKFTKQIKDLIGREPRLVKNENGSYSIFYE